MNLKIFYIVCFVAFTIALVTIYVLTSFQFYTEAPAEEIVKQSLLYMNIFSWLSFLGYLILIVLSNILLLKGRKGFFFIFSAVFYIVFLLLDYIYLHDMLFHFKKMSGLWQGEFMISGIIGIVLAFMVATVTTINFFTCYGIKKRKNKNRVGAE